MDISGLPNPVTPILGLRVHGRVPVAVVEDHGVCPRQIDLHSTQSDLVLRMKAKYLLSLLNLKQLRFSFKQQKKFLTSP